jgi:hypothetical protein
MASMGNVGRNHMRYTREKSLFWAVLQRGNSGKQQELGAVAVLDSNVPGSVRAIWLTGKGRLSHERSVAELPVAPPAEV